MRSSGDEMSVALIKKKLPQLDVTTHGTSPQTCGFSHANITANEKRRRGPGLLDCGEHMAGTLIEKFARSMCRAAGLDPEWKRRPTDTVAWQLYSDQAHELLTATLREMMEPSEGMIAAGNQHARYPDGRHAMDDLKRTWCAMLRAFASEHAIALEA